MLTEKDMYVKVAVRAGADKFFTYSCPVGLRAKAVAGQRVLVSLGKREQFGIIVGLTSDSGGFAIKDLLDIPDDSPLISTELLKLAEWVSSYYHNPLGQVLGITLPPGIEEGKPSRPRKSVMEDRLGPAEVPAFKLNPAQAVALGEIVSGTGKFVPFLLHGATGSGKTEVYIQAIEEVLKSGAGAIVLVPEISLTPQQQRRFQARFGDKVAVLHSGLTESQRRQQWRRIWEGEASVVIGARSAVFAPLAKVGIIIVDEEHDGSYKQEEGVRYHGRDVAVMRAKLAGCPVVLGSATPSVESYYNASSGKYKMLELPERPGGRPMPSVSLVDMREQPARAQISQPLYEAAKRHLDAGRQVLFFLNRRGFSDFILCRDCGHVPGCPSCSISLTYHKTDLSLKCHWCGASTPPPDRCIKCGGDKFKFMGGGTEKLEKEVEGLFEGIGITRIDRDTVKGPGGYGDLLDEVESGRSRVMLGTQMVAKGHDMPNIGLVGVVMADYGLHHPDFRAAERTFQVVTQAAGRSGRGDVPGEVIIQTHQPEHYSLTYASGHDYSGFYKEEIEFRRELGYPPFSRLALVIIKAVKKEKASEGANTAFKAFSDVSGKSVSVMGPAPAPVRKGRGKYRFFVVLKSSSSQKLQKAINEGLKALKGEARLSGCSIELDVDPQSLA